MGLFPALVGGSHATGPAREKRRATRLGERTLEIPGSTVGNKANVKGEPRVKAKGGIPILCCPHFNEYNAEQNSWENKY